MNCSGRHISMAQEYPFGKSQRKKRRKKTLHECGFVFCFFFAGKLTAKIVMNER